MERRRWARIIPLATTLYAISFVNRANISQALPSLTRDLHINPVQAGTIVGIFFWGYLCLQVPGGFLASRWSTKWFVSILMVLWGSCAIGCGLVHTWQQLWVMRLLLGISEGGMYPAVLILISHWFPRQERARANACFSLAIPLSLALSAPFSGWLLDRWNWRTMLAVEGAFPLLWLIVWVIGIKDYPRQASWLSSDERDYLDSELHRDIASREPAARESFWPALVSPQVLLLSLIKLLMLSGQLGYLFWLPSAIEKNRHVSNFVAGLLYTIPFIVGAISMIVISSSSDRRRNRRGHVALAMGIGGVALLGGVLTSQLNPVLAYALVCLASVGAFAPLGPFWAIPTETFSRKMAGSIAGFINGIGNLGGYFGPLLVGYLNKRTGTFTYGFAMLGAFMLIGAALSFGVVEPVKQTPQLQASMPSD